MEQSPTAERLAQCFRWLIAGCLLTLPILSCFYGNGYGFDWVTVKFGSDVLDTLEGRPEQRRAGDELGPSGGEYGTIKAGSIYELVPGGRGAYVIGRFGLDLPAQQYPSGSFEPPRKILATVLGVGFHW